MSCLNSKNVLSTIFLCVYSFFIEMSPLYVNEARDYERN